MISDIGPSESTAREFFYEIAFPLEYFTLRQYCEHYSIEILKSKVQSIGKELTAMSVNAKKNVKKMFDERYGSVNSYHEDILDEYFKYTEKINPGSRLAMSFKDQDDLEHLGGMMDEYMRALKENKWIASDGKIYEIEKMNKQHLRSTIAMLKRDNWPKILVAAYTVRMLEAIDNKPKTKDIDFSEQFLAAENRMWKVDGSYVHYSKMEEGHLKRSIGWVKRCFWPKELKNAYVSGMTEELEKMKQTSSK